MSEKVKIFFEHAGFRFKIPVSMQLTSKGKTSDALGDFTASRGEELISMGAVHRPRGTGNQTLGDRPGSEGDIPESLGECACSRGDRSKSPAADRKSRGTVAALHERRIYLPRSGSSSYEPATVIDRRYWFPKIPGVPSCLFSISSSVTDCWQPSCSSESPPMFLSDDG